MGEGVSFVDGDISAKTGTSLTPGMGMSNGGPMETPSDDAGRSAGMKVGNFDMPMPRGGQLDCPAEY